MQKLVEEFDKTLEISGFRAVHVADGKAFSQKLMSKLPRGCEVQLFDADLVATWQHLYFAVVNALTNQENERGVSKSIAVETALFASAQRQIQKALNLVGLKPTSENAAVVVVCDDEASAEAGLEAATKLFGAVLDESVLQLTDAKVAKIRKAFDVGDAELQSEMAKGNGAEKALVGLIVERVALLSTRL